MDNPDSRVGLFAPDSDCYDEFKQLFNPVIEDYHNIDLKKLKFKHDFGDPNNLPEFTEKYTDEILRSRIMVARTVEGK